MTLKLAISPSNLSRRAACPGSARLEASLPSGPSSEAAEEGTRLHAVMEEYARTGKLESESLLDPEQRSMLDVCAIEAAQILNEFAVTETEKQVDLSSIGIPPAEGRNRVDLAGIDPGVSISFLDYKFGRLYVPAPVRNPQFKAYAVGLLEEYGGETVTGIKVQPRANKPWDVVSHTWKAEELAGPIADELREIVAKANDPEAPLVAGDHCRYCSARELCPARSAIVRSLPMSEPLTVQKFFGEIHPPARSEFYERLLLAEKWVADVKKAADAEILAGVEVPGFGKGNARGTRKWADDDKALAALRSLALEIGKDPEDCITRKIITPAGVEDIFGKRKAVTEVVSSLAITVPGAEKVVRTKKGESLEC